MCRRGATLLQARAFTRVKCAPDLEMTLVHHVVSPCQAHASALAHATHACADVLTLRRPCKKRPATKFRRFPSSPASGQAMRRCFSIMPV